MAKSSVLWLCVCCRTQHNEALLSNGNNGQTCCHIKWNKGITSTFPGAYLCYYSIPNSGQVFAAHEMLHEFIADEGPFDGVLGFPQGAALAAAIILYHTRDFPICPADSFFKTVIFLYGSPPIDVHSQPESAVAIGDEHETASTQSILAEF